MEPHGKASRLGSMSALAYLSAKAKPDKKAARELHEKFSSPNFLPHRMARKPPFARLACARTAMNIIGGSLAQICFFANINSQCF